MYLRSDLFTIILYILLVSLSIMNENLKEDKKKYLRFDLFDNLTDMSLLDIYYCILYIHLCMPYYVHFCPYV